VSKLRAKLRKREHARQRKLRQRERARQRQAERNQYGPAVAPSPAQHNGGTVYYHGGAGGLSVGDEILPASQTGRIDEELAGTCRYDADVIFVTTNPHFAAVYALTRGTRDAFARGDGGFAAVYALTRGTRDAFARGDGGGELYEVEPLGQLWPDKTNDIDSPLYPVSFCCERARVVRRLRLPFQLRQAWRERMALLPAGTRIDSGEESYWVAHYCRLAG
jgi:hypothetical protein